MKEPMVSMDYETGIITFKKRPVSWKKRRFNSKKSLQNYRSRTRNSKNNYTPGVSDTVVVTYILGVGNTITNVKVNLKKSKK